MGHQCQVISRAKGIKDEFIPPSYVKMTEFIPTNLIPKVDIQ